MSSRFDEVDRKILSILHRNAVTPKAEIARQVALAASAVSERIKQLEKSGIIQKYETRLNAEALGETLLAFISVSEIKPNNGFDTANALKKVTGVEEVHKIAGDDCFLIKLRVSGTDKLATVLDQEINTIQSVSKVKTTIVLRSEMEEPPLFGSPLLNQ